MMGLEPLQALGRGALGFEGGEHFIHHFADVAANRHIRPEHLAKLAGVPINLRNLFAGEEFRVP